MKSDHLKESNNIEPNANEIRSSTKLKAFNRLIFTGASLIFRANINSSPLIEL